MYQEKARDFVIEEKADEAIIKEYCDTFKDDQLTKFLNLL